MKYIHEQATTFSQEKKNLGLGVWDSSQRTQKVILTFNRLSLIALICDITFTSQIVKTIIHHTVSL